MSKFSVQQAFPNSNPTELPPDVLVAMSDNPILKDRLEIVTKRASFVREHMRAKSNTHDNLVQRLQATSNAFAAWKRDHERSGTPMPSDKVKEFEAQIHHFREKANAVANDPSQYFLDDTDGMEQFIIRARKILSTSANVPPLDEIDVSPESFQEAHAETVKLRKALGKVVFAPRPADYVKEIVAADLDQMARHGKPGVKLIRSPDDTSQRTGGFEISRGLKTINWPMIFARPGEEFMVPDVLSAFVWLNRDAIQKKIFAEIDTFKDPGMTAEAKTAAVEDIQEKLASAIRTEDAILCELEKRGQYEFRREAFHPAVLLALPMNAKAICEF